MDADREIKQFDQFAKADTGLVPEDFIGSESNAEILCKLPPLQVKRFNSDEKKAILLELISYAYCKNETIPDLVVEAWITEFERLQMSAYQVIKSIRVAKLLPKKFVTEFASFVSIDTSVYNEYYRHTLAPKHEPWVGRRVKVIKDCTGPWETLWSGEEYIVESDYPHGAVSLKSERCKNIVFPREYFRLIENQIITTNG